MNYEDFEEGMSCIKGFEKSNFQPLMLYALEHYRNQSYMKHYHNARHAVNVVQALHKIEPSPLMSLCLAAMWHDAVYIPGCGENHNEVASAQALRCAYQFNCQEAPNERFTIDCAADLIKQTTIAHHLTLNLVSRNLSLLLDADLSSFAVDYDEFVTIQHNIILENTTEVNDQSLGMSAEFLQKFLQRENIFRTYTARTLWEEKARKNIQRWVDSNLGKL